MFVIKGFMDNRVCYFKKIEKQMIWGSEWDVRTCSATIDGATLYSTVEEAEEVCNNLLSDKFKIYPVCPICGEDYSEYPAISRKDNKTRICPNCGTGEALMDYIDNLQKNKTTNM